MSLEATIAENTVAIRELIALLSAGAVIDKAKEPKSKSDAKTEDKPAKTKAEPVTAKTEDEVTKAEAEPEIEQIELVTSKITYEHVSRAIVSLHRAKGREAALEVLDKFGLKNAREATEEQWPQIIEAATTAMEA